MYNLPEYMNNGRLLVFSFFDIRFSFILYLFSLSVSFSTFYTYKCKCECKVIWRMDLFTHVSSIHTYMVWLPTTHTIFFPSIFSHSPFLALRLRLYSQPCSCSIRYVRLIQTQRHLLFKDISCFLLSFPFFFTKIMTRARQI